MFKRIILGFICVGAIASPSALAQEVPFSPDRPTQYEVKNQTENATAIIQKQREGGQSARDAADDLWETMMSPEGVYYPAMIEGLRLLTGMGFLGWAITSFWNWRKGQQVNILAMIQPAMVILMFQNNGALMSATVNGGRYVLNTLNNQIFDAAVNGVTGREAVMRDQNFSAYVQTLQNELKQCAGKVDPEEFATCEEQGKKKAKADLDELTGDPNFLDQFGAFSTATVVKLGISPALMGVSFTFFLILEYLLSFWGLLAPLFVASHLLPKGQLGIKMMASGLIGIATATLSYTVLSSACAVFLGTAFAGNPMIYAVLVGVVNPFLSLGIGAMGISAGLSGTGQAISFGSRFFRRLA